MGLNLCNRVVELKLTAYIAYLPDADMEVALTEFEDAAEQDLQENAPLS